MSTNITRTLGYIGSICNDFATAVNNMQYENFRRSSGRDWALEEGRDGKGYFTRLVKREWGGRVTESVRRYDSYWRMQKAYDSWNRPF